MRAGLLLIEDVETLLELDFRAHHRLRLEDGLDVAGILVLVLDQAEFGQRERAGHDLWMIAAENDAQRHAGVLVGVGRRLDTLDQYLVDAAADRGDGHHVDLHAVLPGEARLLIGLAQVLVAVADEDDALGGPFGERR